MKFIQIVETHLWYMKNLKPKYINFIRYQQHFNLCKYILNDFTHRGTNRVNYCFRSKKFLLEVLEAFSFTPSINAEGKGIRNLTF